MKKTVIYFGIPTIILVVMAILLAGIVVALSKVWIIVIVSLASCYGGYKLIEFIRIGYAKFREIACAFGVRLAEYSIVKFGKARSGKTLTSVIEAYFTAVELWAELCSKYLMYSMLVYLRRYYEDEVFMARYEEVNVSYHYWKSRPYLIPCLYSNMDIEDKCGRHCQSLHMEHLDQKERIMAYAVVLVDECGSLLDISLSNDKNKYLNNLIRWCGQFAEIHFIFTEQRPTNIPIDIRGVVGLNESVKMKRCLKPVFGYIVVDFLTRLGHNFKYSPKYFHSVNILKKWLDGVGYFKFVFETMGNLDYARGKAEKRVCYIYCDLPFSYESRAYSPMYHGLTASVGEDSQGYKLVYPDSQIGQAIIREELKETKKKK